MPKKEIAKIEYSKRFAKNLSKAPSSVIKAFKKRRQLFILNSDHPQLHNHPLKGDYKGMHSINVTGDWRALYRKVESRQGQVRKQHITFELLGTHSQLYK